MRQFFKFLFASCLGTLVAAFVLVIVSLFFFGRVASMASEKVSLSPNSVMVIRLTAPIPEKTNNTQLDYFTFSQDDVLGLNKIVAAIENAKNDKNIKGISIQTGYNNHGLATYKAIRDAIEDFKVSGKFVSSYSDMYTQNSYYLSSIADDIWVNPIGMIDFRGYGAAIPFFKDMLDNIGVEMEIYYAGQFKSATEPFRLNKMSDQNRLQTREYINEFYNIYLDAVSTARGVPVKDLRNIANKFLVQSSEDALGLKMLDNIGQKGEYVSSLKEKVGIDPTSNLRTISVGNYYSTLSISSGSGSDKIAVLFAEGELVDGNNSEGAIDGDKYASLIRKIRKDKRVKAVVLRVNSPGGSILASDKILAEIKELKKAGIPVVTSMGDLAASGGYYIACHSDSIVSEPNTITGSIGVFMMVPTVENLMNNKLAIHFDTVGTGSYTTAFLPYYNWGEREGIPLQKRTDKYYEQFLNIVAEGRNMHVDDVQKIAQGRVWSGAKAVEIGLVDRLGNLQDAIDIASSLAGIEKYRLVEYPFIKDPLTRMIDEFTGKKSNSPTALIQAELGEYYPYYRELKRIKSMSGIQARLPYTIEIK